MKEFILEEQLNHVINKNTKEYLKEVVSSYNNENYRAAVTVLYTTVIYDLLQKVVVLKEIYNDSGANKILEDVKRKQSNKLNRSNWENDLIDKVFNETKIISMVEKDELLHLKVERNYAAHPIIKLGEQHIEDLELKSITKETASDLIRKAFEIVFLRDAILAKNIDKEIVADLNNYYERVKTDGLENYLNAKYFRRMTQERKDRLFKSMWKLVFIVDDEYCKVNRESNYWGLLYLYNENKKQYQQLIKKDLNNYFDKFQLETIESSYSDLNSVDSYAITIFKLRSRMIHMIKFLENSPEMFDVLNDYAKNTIQQSINHMYMKADDVTKKSMSQVTIKNSYLFKEQVKLNSETVFISDDILKHYDTIFSMINNYIKTENNWSELNNYFVLDEQNLEVIFNQSEYRGYINDFLTFLIKYCMGAQQYTQAINLFSYLKKYSKYFLKKHYYMILTEMNGNTQYYTNNNKVSFLNELEKMFADRFDTELIQDHEEKYLYNELFSVEEGIRAEKLMELINERAEYYVIWNLEILLNRVLKDNQMIEFLKKQNSSSYANIFNVLNNRNDPNYSEGSIKYYKKYFND